MEERLLTYQVIQDHHHTHNIVESIIITFSRFKNIIWMWSLWWPTPYDLIFSEHLIISHVIVDFLLLFFFNYY